MVVDFQKEMEISVEEVRRGAGRPDAAAAQALDERILDEATKLFIREGYAATSMEQIAAAAGSGKQTVYRRYPSKEELFTAVVTRRARRLTESASANRLLYADPLDALRETARSFLDFLCQDDAISLYRVVIAESQRFPSVIERVTEDSIKPFHEAMGEFLKEAVARGQVRADCNVEATVRCLVGVTAGWGLQQGLVGRPGLSDPVERRAHFETAWDLFLHGVLSVSV